MRRNLKDDDEKAELALDAPPDDALTATAVVAKKPGKRYVALPWDVSSFYSVQAPELADANDVDDVNDEATLRRLELNDLRTRDMTREEYAVWAECRHASFTWRKSKRFKEWAKLADVHDGGRVGEDVIDILGFLTAEMVQRLGVDARKVLEEEEGAVATDVGKGQRREREGGLFALDKEAKRPIERRHVQEAFRRLQGPNRRMRAFGGLGARGGEVRRLELVSTSV